MKMTTPKELIKDLTKEGVFDHDISRSNVINYFQGQIHALEGVEEQIKKLNDFLYHVKTDLSKVLAHAESFDKTEH